MARASQTQATAVPVEGTEGAEVTDSLAVPTALPAPELTQFSPIKITGPLWVTGRSVADTQGMLSDVEQEIIDGLTPQTREIISMQPDPNTFRFPDWQAAIYLLDGWVACYDAVGAVVVAKNMNESGMLPDEDRKIIQEASAIAAQAGTSYTSAVDRKFVAEIRRALGNINRAIAGEPLESKHVVTVKPVKRVKETSSLRLDTPYDVYGILGGLEEAWKQFLGDPCAKTRQNVFKAMEKISGSPLYSAMQSEMDQMISARQGGQTGKTKKR